MEVKKVLSDFQEIMEEYPKAMNEEQKDHPLAKRMRNDFKDDLKSFVESITDSSYNFRISPGMMGRWANPPWAGIKSSRFSNKFTEGLYVIYHFRVEDNIIDLSINQGLDVIKRSEAINTAKELRKHVVLIDGFSLDDDPEYGSSQTAVLYKKYDVDNIDSLEFINDLKNLLDAYEKLLPYYTDTVSTVDLGTDGIGDSVTDETNYWLFSPGPGASMWNTFYNQSVMGMGGDYLGDLNHFATRDDIVKALQKHYNNNSRYPNDSLAYWQMFNEIKPGDIVFAKKGVHEIVGYGIVESGYFFDESLGEYAHAVGVNWKEKGHWPYKGTLAMKTLTKITDYTDLVNTINDFFEKSPTEIEPEIKYPSYTSEDFLDEVFLSEDDYNTLSQLLKHKRNIILQGAPGVGKTFIAKRLAYSLLGCKDKSRVSMVQFHQSYSYEDFIMGYRPSGKGFILKNGIFYDFCKKAQDDEENDYYFIIDEINRGNLSKIFGELFMLIENDKRGNKNKIQLLYNDEFFYIPKNVYIIGMMNTADRSLAMLDYALRRRFAFFNLMPAFDSDNFREYMKILENPKFNNLINTIRELNEEICLDETLGKGFMIGHSYFTNLKQENVNEKLKYIIEYEIIPLLNEYWFDEESKVEQWSLKLRSVIR